MTTQKDNVPCVVFFCHMGVVKSPVPYLPKTDAPSNVNFRRIKQVGYPNI